MICEQGIQESASPVVAWIMSKEEEYTKYLQRLTALYSDKRGLGVFSVSGLLFPEMLTGRTFCDRMSHIVGNALVWKFPDLAVNVCDGSVLPYNHINHPSPRALGHTWVEVDGKEVIDMTAKQFHPLRPIISHFPVRDRKKYGYQPSESEKLIQLCYQPRRENISSGVKNRLSNDYIIAYEEMLSLFEIPLQGP